EDVLRLAAVEPIVVGQVREAERAARIGAMAARAVAQEDIAADRARAVVAHELVEGFALERCVERIVPGEDRVQALVALLLLGPSLDAGEIAQPGIEDEIAHAE